MWPTPNETTLQRKPLSLEVLATRSKTPLPSPIKSPKPTGNLPPTSNALTIAFVHGRQREKDVQLPVHLPPRHPLSPSRPRPPAPTQVPWTLAPSDHDSLLKNTPGVLPRTCASTVEDKAMLPDSAPTNLATPSVVMKLTSPLPLHPLLPLPLAPPLFLPTLVPLPPSPNLPSLLFPNRRKTSGPMC